MDKERILNIVKSYISQANNNLSIENNKFDFKRKWYDLKSGSGISEFLKDTTAIVNTVGLEGLIVLGFDDKKKKFFDSKFSDSNLNGIPFRAHTKPKLHTPLTLRTEV